MAEDSSSFPIKIGETVYDGAGEPVGMVRGFDEGGFYVSIEEGFDALSIEREHPGPVFGEAELMWRCSNCGTMGELDDLPEACPDCGAAVENLSYWTED